LLGSDILYLNYINIWGIGIANVLALTGQD